jgi:hypothetical protein
MASAAAATPVGWLQPDTTNIEMMPTHTFEGIRMIALLLRLLLPR